MKKLLLAIIGSVILLAGGHATAADLAARPYTKAPMVAPAAVYDWTGFYVGGNIGGVTLSDKQDQYDAGSGCWWDCSDPEVHSKMRGTGVLGGVQAGYNWQSGVWVFGIEADLDGTSAKSTLNSFCNGSGYCDLTQRASLDALGTLRGRIGYAFDRALVYATGGLAFARVHNHVNDNDDPGLWDQSSWRAGWTVGAGLEYAIASNWSVKVEGLYYKLENKTLVFTNSGAVYDPNKFTDNGVLARVSVNYKFGGPVVARY